MPNTTLDQSSVTTLKTLEGATLKCISGYRLFTDPDVFFGRVRLCFSGGRIDIVNGLKDVAFDTAGTTEEVGVLSVEPPNSPIWLPDGEKMSTEQFDTTLDAVYVVEDAIRFMDGSTEICVHSFTQAIVFQTGDEYIGFDKGAWFDEYVNVSRGDSIESVVRDCSNDWITDVPFWNEFSRKIIRL